MAGETIDGRRLFTAVALVVAAVAVLAGVARLAGGTGTDSAAPIGAGGSSADARPTVTTVATTLAGSGVTVPSARPTTTTSLPDVATPDVLGDGHEDVGGEPPDDIEDARTVAGAFATAYSSYRFDEPADAPLERARPFLTPEAADALASNSGASDDRAGLEERQEVAEATVDAVLTEGYTDDRVGYTVIVVQRITTIEGTTELYLAYHVTVERDPEVGWLVSEVGIT